MTTFRAVLFDAADTLFHTRERIGEIYWSEAQNYGSTATPDALHRAFVRHLRTSNPQLLAAGDGKQWWKEIVRKVFEEVGMISRFDEYFDTLYELFRGANGWVLFPETKEVLARLKSLNLRLGVVSNFDSRLDDVTDSLGIRNFLDSLTIPSRAGFAKPDARIFLFAVRSLSVEPAEAVFVGDNPDDDVEGAGNAGLFPILIDRKLRYDGLGCLRITSLEELLPIVESSRHL